MRRLANILFSATVLILLLFGSSGVTMVTCTCSGRTTVATPFEHGCCRSDSPCMSVTHVHLSDSEALTATALPQLDAAAVAMPPSPETVLVPASHILEPQRLVSPPLPPPRSARPAVLRV